MVTNVILICSLEEDDALAQLNKLLLLSETYSHVIPFQWLTNKNTSGNRAVDCEICVAAFNYMGEDEFVEMINSIAWKYPEEFQLFLKRQEEYKFTEKCCFDR